MVKKNSTGDYLAKIREYSVPLILGIIIALIWANVDYDTYYKFLHAKIFGITDMHFLVNDIFLVFFFGVLMVEIVHGFSPEGSLHPIKNAVANLFGAFGGVVVPIIVFFTLNYFWGTKEYSNGWAIGTATDIAVALMFAKFIFPKKHPAFAFLLLLAVADDIAGLVIIALFYPTPGAPVQLEWFSLVVIAMTLGFLFDKIKIKSWFMYIFICGFVSWLGMFKANLHPALALVFIVPLIPHKKRILGNPNQLDRFEHATKPYVDYGLFFFGLANAGVPLSNVSALTVIVILSLLLGKTIGIFGLTKAAKLFGFGISKKIKKRELLAISLTASIGLTVSLFISDIAYTEEHLKDAAKMGALLSIMMGFLAIIVGRALVKSADKSRTKTEKH